MAGEIFTAFTYITSENRGQVRLIFDTSIYDLLPVLDGRIKYRARQVNDNNIYGDRVDWIYPLTDVSNVQVFDNGKIVDFTLDFPFLKTRIEFQNSAGDVLKFINFDFIDNYFSSFSDSFFSITREGVFKVWYASTEFRLPKGGLLRGKILNNQGEVLAICTGYHLQNPSIQTGVTMENGIDIYRRILTICPPEKIPADGEECFFVFDFNGDIFYDSIFYNSSTRKFYKPLPDEDINPWKVSTDFM